MNSHWWITSRTVSLDPLPPRLANGITEGEALAVTARLNRAVDFHGNGPPGNLWECRFVRLYAFTADGNDSRLVTCSPHLPLAR